MITGLTLDDSVNDLARKFNVTLEVSPHYRRRRDMTVLVLGYRLTYVFRRSHSRLDISWMR